MKENETQELAVTDNDADEMEQVLSYIYTNSLDITPSNVVPILYAAEKYLLRDLKQICETKMHRYFSFETCGELYKIANRYGLCTIKIRALQMRMLFTKQFETRNRSSTLNRIKVMPQTVTCNTPHEIAHHDVDLNKFNSEVDSACNPDPRLVKQELFLPYADLWLANNRRGLFQHSWRIKNFAGLKHSGTLMTRTFFDDFYKASYKMIINASYNSNEEDEIEYSVKLNFSVLSTQNELSLIEFRSCIVPVLGDLKNIKTYFGNFKVNEVSEMFSMNISRNDVNSLLHNGDLLISCKCWNLSLAYYCNETPDLKDNLTADFSGIYTSHKFSDLIIKVGSSEFQCHKAVISCRSRFFAEMLEERKNEVTITLDDIDKETFEKILCYMYTDQCDSVEEDAWELLPFVSKYELEHLKLMCEKHLISSLNLENVVDALQLSISHSAPTLQKYALRYVRENSLQIFSMPDTISQIEKCDISKIFDNAQ